MIINILISNLSAQDKFILIISFTAAVIMAIMLHEWAHAWVAYKNGDLVAKLSGRLSLNPKAHFDVYGLLMFFIVGFGWAKPVPINPDNFKNKRVGIFTTAISGVTMNLIIAFLCFGLSNLVLLVPSDVLVKSNFVYAMFKLLYYFFYFSTLINVSLIAFNLLPIYPLDGFRVVQAFTKPTNPYVKFMEQYGSFVLLGVIILSRLLGNIAPALDIFGMYFEWVQTIVDKLFKLIWGVVLTV